MVDVDLVDHKIVVDEYTEFTDALDSQMYKHREMSKLAWGEISKMMKIDEKKLQTRMYKLSREGKWNKKLLKGEGQ